MMVRQLVWFRPVIWLVSALLVVGLLVADPLPVWADEASESLVDVQQEDSSGLTEVVGEDPDEFEATGDDSSAEVLDEGEAASEEDALVVVEEKQPVARAAAVALAAGVSVAPRGDFSVTSLRPSSAWVSGGQSGDFSWSYGLAAPEVEGGLTPGLVLSYSSGTTDGEVSNTNNQASWVGEGFDLASSFIERKYVGCVDDPGGTSGFGGDLCWYSDPQLSKDPWDNAFLSLAGHSGRLVRTTDLAGVWRLESDDGTRVWKMGDPVYAGQGAYYDERWMVITPDGAMYNFGAGKSDAPGGAATNSVWSVPVAANHPGEPGYSSSFAASIKSRPYRWNLDYVVSPLGQTMTFYYEAEKNQYYQNGQSRVTYDRGGYLKSIYYGETWKQELSDSGPARVVFTVSERCVVATSSSCMTADPTDATAKAWPDVPMDLLCLPGGYCPTPQASPSFFSRKKLDRVDSYTRNSAGTGWDAAAKAAKVAAAAADAANSLPRLTPGPSTYLQGPVPRQAMDTLEFIDLKGSPMPGYKGGKQWLNDGSQGAQILPRTDSLGQSITYREWDTVPSTPRGPERLVTGSDGSAYDTADHYTSFYKIR